MFIFIVKTFCFFMFLWLFYFVAVNYKTNQEILKELQKLNSKDTNGTETIEKQ